MALYRDQEFLADNIRARQSCSQRGGLSWAEESGELSIWHCMPTTCFHPVGLLVDDLDWNAALLPSIFFSLPLLTGQQRLHSESRARQWDRTVEHVTEWHTVWETKKKNTFSSPHLIFCSSTVFLCFCVLYLLSSRAASLGWEEKGLSWAQTSLCFECLQASDFTKTCRISYVLEKKWNQEIELTRFPLIAQSGETGACLSVSF